MERLKLTSVGDDGVGKTCLFISYTKNTFPSLYIPNSFEYYVIDVQLDGELYPVLLNDTSTQGEDFYRLRPPLYYPKTDIFMMVFSIENKTSLDNIGKRWLPEVREYCPYIPAILVANKIDLRNSSERTDLITTKEGMEMARKLGFNAYCEVSALTMEGLKEFFGTAVREAMRYIQLRKSIIRSRGIFGKIKKEIPIPVAPIMPVAEKEPEIVIEISAFSEDWRKVLRDCQHTDVTFIVEERHKIEAHQLVLCAASVFFQELLGFKSNDKTVDEISGKWNFENIATVIESDSKQHLTIQFELDIQLKTFQHILQFLYTGDPMISTPDNSTDEENIKHLREVATVLSLSQLETICDNILNDQDFLNQQIISNLNNDTGRRMKELFLDNSEYADIKFQVEGMDIYANKLVICARSDMMSAMFDGSFVESRKSSMEVTIPNVTSECFLALLEYLYSDQFPMHIPKRNYMTIMMVADAYCQTRLLNLCELHIADEVKTCDIKNLEKSELNVIELALSSKIYNGNQLSIWCLHLIACNYLIFEKMNDFNKLTGDNRKYIEEHRWPPAFYIEEMETYEQKIEQLRGNKKCSVM